MPSALPSGALESIAGLNSLSKIGSTSRQFKNCAVMTKVTATVSWAGRGAVLLSVTRRSARRWTAMSCTRRLSGQRRERASPGTRFIRDHSSLWIGLLEANETGTLYIEHQSAARSVAKSGRDPKQVEREVRLTGELAGRCCDVD